VSGDDQSTPEPGVAIDLSRRKDRSNPLGIERTSLDAGRESGNLDVVRRSVVGAERVAAPYVTMTRIALTRLTRDRLARAGGLLLAWLALVCVFADVLASDLPVVCRFHGAVYVLPNITRPSELAGTDCARMQRDQSPGDWMIQPLVADTSAASGSASDGQVAAEALLAPLSRGHPFGTDANGNDVFARVVHGTRTAFGVGLGASALLVAIGVVLGALAGFAGGIVDALVARAVESLTAIPTLLLVLVVGALVPNPTRVTLLLTIALTRWTELARLVRAEVLSALGSDYVAAARALGAPLWRVLWRHVLPNAIGPAIVGATFAVAWVVLVEASVDFLRGGSLDGAASWGQLMGEARTHDHAWWLVVFPGSALLATLIALNMVGEAARNALDPRLRGGVSG
jgi:peptide/nickel transport system permease protein